MNHKELPLTKMTDTLLLHKHFSSDDTLPKTMEEVDEVLKKAPKKWRGVLLVFPRCIQKGIQKDHRMVTAFWNNQLGVWEKSYQLLGNARVQANSIIPTRLVG